jgi:cell division protein FtsW
MKNGEHKKDKIFLQGKGDGVFLGLVLLLSLIGVFLFSSASLSLIPYGSGRIGSIFFSQIFLGLGGGLVAFFLAYHIPYTFYKKYAIHFFLFSVLFLFSVFIPHFGYEANGAKRWVDIFGFSFQPSEVTKIGFIFFIAWYYSTYASALSRMRPAMSGIILALMLVSLPLFLQPDIGTIIILAIVGFVLFFASGVKWKYVVFLFLLGLIFGSLLALSKPYVLERITTFFSPEKANLLEEGYHLQQSLISIGSGGLFGKGYGQSTQKFGYLPEAMGDAFFSVAGEELGFLGASFIIILFLIFFARGMLIAYRAPDRFGSLLVLGIMFFFITQSFINIGSMLGAFPLTGDPLIFMSQGGSALFFSLFASGIVLNVSRSIQKKKK